MNMRWLLNLFSPHTLVDTGFDITSKYTVEKTKNTYDDIILNEYIRKITHLTIDMILNDEFITKSGIERFVVETSGIAGETLRKIANKTKSPLDDKVINAFLVGYNK